MGVRIAMAGREVKVIRSSVESGSNPRCPCGNEKPWRRLRPTTTASPPTLGRINNEFSLAVAHAKYARAASWKQEGRKHFLTVKAVKVESISR